MNPLRLQGHTLKQRQSRVDEGIELEPMSGFGSFVESVLDVTQKALVFP